MLTECENTSPKSETIRLLSQNMQVLETLDEICREAIRVELHMWNMIEWYKQKIIDEVKRV